MNEIMHVNKADAQTGSFEERLRAKFRSRASSAIPLEDSCLLLDISGSMRDYIGANITKIDELRKLADNFRGVRRFTFACSAQELKSSDVIGEAWGGTNMAQAFLSMKAAGIKHVVMITDGRPDNAAAAIRESQGLLIDVFYVGPDPAPQFLRDLARRTGGQYQGASLNTRPALESKVRGLLAPAGGTRDA